MSRTTLSGGAALSKCGTYRFNLWRTWDTRKQSAVFVGLNPSTADATRDDNTIRRCIGFARQWGFGGLVMVNLFPLRSRSPKALPGPLNQEAEAANRAAVIEACEQAGILIACWGSAWLARDRGVEYLDLASKWHCLGQTKSGAPRHPLYLASDTKPIPYPCNRCGQPSSIILTDLRTGWRECLPCHAWRSQPRAIEQLVLL